MSNSIFGSFDIGREALLAHQQVLNTIGHNLANASTPGYSRQRAELVAVSPRDGVHVADVQRIRDQFVDAMVLNEMGATGSAEARQGALSRLEAVFNDPAGSGLSATLDQFFQGFQDLSVHPTDQALRVNLQNLAQRVADSFQGLRGRLDQMKADLGSEIQQRATDANVLLDQIAGLNRSLMNAAGQPTPNDLLDQRDQLVAQLDRVIGVAVTARPDGSVQLNAVGSGILLVAGDQAVTLTATPNAPADTVDLVASGVPLTPKSGQLGALLELRNSPTGAVRQAQADLDTLARTFIDQVNRLHASGSGLTESTSLTSLNAVSASNAALDAAGLAFPPGTGSFRVIAHDASGNVLSTVTVAVTAGSTTLDDIQGDIDADANLAASVSGGKLTITAAPGVTFTFADDTSGALAGLGLNTLFTGQDSLTIGLDPLVANDPTKLAAARADTAGLVHPGDGSNALAVADLAGQTVLSGGSQTFTGFYGALVGRVGAAARDANQALDRQQTALQTVQALQAQTSGVSMDEELVNLQQTQSAYAAAARFITTMDDVIQTLLAMAR